MIPEEGSSEKSLRGRAFSLIHCLLGAPTILLGARSNSQDTFVAIYLEQTTSSWDMLGAPSNLVNGLFFHLCKNLKKRYSSRKNHAPLPVASFLLPVPGTSSSPRDPRARLLRSDAFCLRGWSP